VSGQALVPSITLDNCIYQVALEEIVRVAKELEKKHADELADERAKSQALIEQLTLRVSARAHLGTPGAPAAGAGGHHQNTTLRGRPVLIMAALPPTAYAR
jgi:hypothetical protein